MLKGFTTNTQTMLDGDDDTTRLTYEAARREDT